MKKISRLLFGILAAACIFTGSLSCAAAISGDVNGDNTRDAGDLAALRQILLGARGKTANADVNGDGDVDIRDLVNLKKQLSSPDGYWVSGTDQGHDDIFSVK